MAGISKAERERRAAAAAAPASASTPAAPAQPAAAAAPAGREKSANAATIRMTRDEPVHAKGPTEADVHPDEVENWKLAGWREA